MKYSEISGLAPAELTKRTSQLEISVFESKMKNSLGQLANPMEIRKSRRDIARLKTAMAAKSGKAPLSKASREDRIAALAKAQSKKAAQSTAAKG